MPQISPLRVLAITCICIVITAAEGCSPQDVPSPASSAQSQTEAPPEAQAPQLQVDEVAKLSQLTMSGPSTARVATKPETDSLRSNRSAGTAATTPKEPTSVAERPRKLNGPATLDDLVAEFHNLTNNEVTIKVYWAEIKELGNVKLREISHQDMNPTFGDWGSLTLKPNERSRFKWESPPSGGSISLGSGSSKISSGGNTVQIKIGGDVLVGTIVSSQPAGTSDVVRMRWERSPGYAFYVPIGNDSIRPTKMSLSEADASKLDRMMPRSDKDRLWRMPDASHPIAETNRDSTLKNSDVTKVVNFINSRIDTTTQGVAEIIEHDIEFKSSRLIYKRKERSRYTSMVVDGTWEVDLKDIDPVGLVFQRESENSYLLLVRTTNSQNRLSWNSIITDQPSLSGKGVRPPQTAKSMHSEGALVVSHLSQQERGAVYVHLRQLVEHYGGNPSNPPLKIVEQWEPGPQAEGWPNGWEERYGTCSRCGGQGRTVGGIFLEDLNTCLSCKGIGKRVEWRRKE